MTYLRHVTLTSGHVRDSAADEVPAAMSDALAPLLAHLAASGARAQTIPLSAAGADLPGYSLAGRASRHCMVATVWADGPPSVVVATIAVALRSRCGAPIWRGLHRHGTLPVRTDPARQPPAPWVAAALEHGSLLHPDCLGWLGDFERCLAWAFARQAGA